MTPEFDPSVRPILQELHAQGIKTAASCQGGGAGTHFNNAYIAFHDEEVKATSYPKIREIVKHFTTAPFKIYKGYFYGEGLDPDAGMHSLIFGSPGKIQSI